MALGGVAERRLGATACRGEVPGPRKHYDLAVAAGSANESSMGLSATPPYLLWQVWRGPASGPGQIFFERSRSALPMTLTDDRAIAAAAMIGESRIPNTG